MQRSDEIGLRLSEARGDGAIRLKLLLVLAVFAFGLTGAFAAGYLVHELRLPIGEDLEATYRWSRQFQGMRSVYGRLSGRKGPDHGVPGLWRAARTASPSDGLSDDQAEKFAELAAIGYLEGYEPAPERSGVTRHAAPGAFSGMNLYTSGHAPEAVLMDMDGAVLHRWRLPFDEAYPGRAGAKATGAVHTGMSYWRRAHVLANGDLLAIFEGYGLVKLDADSNLLWARECGCHHDLFVEPDGTIYVLDRTPRVIPRVSAYEPVLEDFVSVLDADGKELRRISLLEAFERSPFASLLAQASPFGDIMHTNTVEVFDGRLADSSPLFRKGNILLSMREMDVIAVLDPDTETIEWALTGQWQAQHQPTLLENGRMLLLDNRGHHGMSKVIEIDPFTQAIQWAYRGTPQNGFATGTGGSVARLANGNTLVTESDSGRAFEITPEHEIVWEFYNDARAGENDELIATLCEVVRLPPDFPHAWAHGVR